MYAKSIIWRSRSSQSKKKGNTVNLHEIFGSQSLSHIRTPPSTQFNFIALIERKLRHNQKLKKKILSLERESLFLIISLLYNSLSVFSRWSLTVLFFEFWLFCFVFSSIQFVRSCWKMDLSQIKNEGRMEGWLYLIRSNRFGLQYSRKRYFVLEDHHLKSFKSVPDSKNQVFFSLSFSL